MLNKLIRFSCETVLTLAVVWAFAQVYMVLQDRLYVGKPKARAIIEGSTVRVTCKPGFRAVCEKQGFKTN